MEHDDKLFSHSFFVFSILCFFAHSSYYVNSAKISVKPLKKFSLKKKFSKMMFGYFCNVFIISDWIDVRAAIIRFKTQWTFYDARIQAHNNSSIQTELAKYLQQLCLYFFMYITALKSSYIYNKLLWEMMNRFFKRRKWLFFASHELVCVWVSEKLEILFIEKNFCFFCFS